MSDPHLPIPISVIGGAYLLFDIDAVTYLRRNHQICGTFIGTLPQNPSQNVFMGLPMQIMPEEARMLVDRGAGHLLDDARAHDAAIAGSNHQRQKEYLEILSDYAAGVDHERRKERQDSKKKGIRREMEKQSRKAQSSASNGEGQDGPAEPELPTPGQKITENDNDSIFGVSGDDAARDSSIATTSESGFLITPTSSSPLHDLDRPVRLSTGNVPQISPCTYAVYRRLHDHPSTKYFATPGLRFGCQFCVYPGDPLRYHSHFLATSYGWEDEIDLMDLVGGGRLGTGVKKGFLIGGRDEDGGAGNETQTFSIEWAAM